MVVNTNKINEYKILHNSIYLKINAMKMVNNCINIVKINVEHKTEQTVFPFTNSLKIGLSPRVNIIV